MTGAAYEASIHLLLKDSVSGALSKIGADVLGLHGKFDKLQHKIAEVAKGMAMLGTGAIMAKLTADTLTANAALEKQLDIYKMMGNSMRDADALRSRSYDTARVVRGSGVAENAKAGRELSAALNDNGGAMKMLPAFERVAQLLKFQTGSEGDQDMLRLAKMIELRGGAIDPKTEKINPALFKGELDAAYKALVTGGGLVTTGDLQMLVKRGGPAVKNMMGNPETFWSEYLAAVEDQGGASAGTGITAIARQFLGGKGQGPTYKEMHRLGLLNKEGWHWNKAHNIEIDDPSKAVKGYDILHHDGVEGLVDKVILPALANFRDKEHPHGFEGSDAINAELYRLGGTETARRVMGLFLTSKGQFKAVGSRLHKALGPDDAAKIMNQDYTHNLEAVSTSLHNFVSAIGDAASVAPILGKLADVFNKLAKVASDHPVIGQMVTWGGLTGAATLGVGGAMRIGGAVMDGFGLGAAATALEGSAAALTTAATKLSIGGAVGGVAGAAEGAAGAAGAAGVAGRLGFLGRLGVVGAGLGEMFPWLLAGMAVPIGLHAYAEAHPEEFRRTGRGGMGYKRYDGPQQFGPVIPHEAIYGPFRHWVDPVASGRGRAAVPGHFEMGRDATDQGKSTAVSLLNAFKAAGFPAAGKAGGDGIVSGFMGAGFNAAGAAAGAQMMSAWGAAMKGLPVPVATPSVSGAKKGGEKHADVYLDKTKVGKIITREQTKMAMMPNAIGGHDSYGSYLGPGSTAMPS